MTSIAKPVGYSPGQFFATLNVANPTPARPRWVQSQSIDWKAKVDELNSDRRFAAAVAGGPVTVTGKVEYSSTNVRIWGDILSGDATASGTEAFVDGETGTVSVSTHTITAANSGTFVKDRGVINTTTNQPLMRVAAGAEASGVSYSVNETTGIYTFANADTGTYKIYYLYAVASSGASIILTNTKQGPQQNFQADMIFPWGIEMDVFSLYNCAPSDGGASLKQGFGSSTLGFTAGVNDNDILGALYFSRAA